MARLRLAEGLAVLAGSLAGLFLEDDVEVFGVFEADLGGNLLERKLGLGEQALDAIEPCPDDLGLG